MKKHAGNLVMLVVFMFMMSGTLQAVYAMGWNPGKGNHGHQSNHGHHGNPGQDNPGNQGVQSVPDSASTLACLGLGIAGIGGYLLMRNRKDKSPSRCC